MDDFGLVINPNMLAGQVHGGIAQGIGQAIFENTVYDDENGQFTNDDCMNKNRVFRIFLPGGYLTEFTVGQNNIAHVLVNPTMPHFATAYGLR